MVSIKTITKFIFLVCLGHYFNRNDCCSIVSHLQDYIPPIESIKPVDAITIYIKTYIIPIIPIIVFWEGFYLLLFSAGNIIMVLLLLQNYLNY